MIEFSKFSTQTLHSERKNWDKKQKSLEIVMGEELRIIYECF